MQRDFSALASMNEAKDDQIVWLNPGEIHTNPQDRNDWNSEDAIEALNLLADNIRQNGNKIDYPIQVELVDGRYIIIDGERRWRASKLLGMTMIPVMIKKGDRVDISFIQLQDNIHNRKLNPMEVAHAIKNRMDSFEMSPEQISQRLGYPIRKIYSALKLLDLHPALQELALVGKVVSEKYLTRLSKFPEPEMMARVDRLNESEITVKQALDDSINYAGINTGAGGDGDKASETDTKSKSTRSMKLNEATLFLVYERLARTKIGRTDADWQIVKQYLSKLEKKAGVK